MKLSVWSEIVSLVRASKDCIDHLNSWSCRVLNVYFMTLFCCHVGVQQFNLGDLSHFALDCWLPSQKRATGLY